jgi:hypothetical protein
MTRKLLLAGIAMLTLAISSCDEDTVSLGTSLTNISDQFTVTSDTFNVSTRSIVADSILSRSQYAYLGKLKDPETGSYITSDFSTQFAMLEKDANDVFVKSDSVISRDADNLPIADSCIVNIVVNTYMGDSLAAMKVKITELAKPLEENRTYYTNFDPQAEGYLRSDGINKSKLYSISDLHENDSVRGKRRSSNYYEYIKIPLNEPYKDRQGKTYNNYGTYLMRTYYEHPEYFKNSSMFTQNVCPGFYFQSTDGLGTISQISHTQILIYFRYISGDRIISSMKSFNGTEEVLQTTHFTNNREYVKYLASINDFTYLKSPDGIFTEVTLPVDEIKHNHENDTIASAKIVFRRLNDFNDNSEEILKDTKYLLMVERDSMYSFFEQRNLANNITSYLATYDSSKHTYTFNNISGLINHMYKNRNKTPDWNKVVLIPVEVTTTTKQSSYSQITTVVASINNELQITSTRLVGGSNNPHEPIRISVVYNKNKK